MTVKKNLNLYDITSQINHWSRGGICKIFGYMVGEIMSPVAYTGIHEATQLRNITFFLPPTKDVWGKVMFSEASVSHSVHRGGVCMMSLPVWLLGPLLLRRGSASREVCL